MGDYRAPKRREEQKSNSWRWVGVSVLSALIGAGTTLVVSPLLQTNLSLNTTNVIPATTGVSAPVSSNISVNVSDAITKVVKKVEPDVVAVVNYTTSSSYFSQQQSTQASDIGSGVLFDKDSQYAYIVTNNHVVQGGSKVQIVLQSQKQVQATVVGTDPYTDLAVLKTPVSNFKGVTPVQFTNSDNIQVGQPAIAIGTPMGLDFADTVTSGIVSGDQRLMPVEEPTSQQTLDYQSVIQTDAAINPGNSGGPLLNISGQLIGINSSKIVAQNFEGMGFAIPANEVEEITSELLKTGHATHPALGISGIDLDTIPQEYLPNNVPVNYGVYVQSVTSSDAKTGGLQQGDIIVAINGKTVQTTADLRTALFKLKPGTQVSVTVYRGGQKKTLTVTLGQMQSPNTTASGQQPSQGSGTSASGQTNPYGSSQGGFGW